MSTSDDEAPTITLGDTTYKVLPVAFREVSKILPLVNTVFTGIRSNDLSESVLEGLGKIIYFGIKRAAGDLGYDAFIDRPATVEEMIAAAIVVCNQAGLKRKEPEPGEATGAIPPISMN